MTAPNVRPPLPVRTRRAWRLFRTQPWVFQGVAALSALVIAVGLVAIAVHGSGSGASTLSAGHGNPGPSQGPGPGNRPGGPASGRHHHGPGGNGGTTTGPKPEPGTSNGPGGAGGTGGGHHGGPQGNPLGATDRGVTANSVRVVFPWPNLSGVNRFAAEIVGSSEDPVESIKAYVRDINAHGGINGRLISPEIVSYDPTDDASMRSLCQRWTITEKVFAVVDAYAWHDANQLCVTEDGHTPLITSFTQVPGQPSDPDPYVKGRPNLWWTGPDLCHVLRNLVHWSVATGRLSQGERFGIVYSTSDSDKLGYRECLTPALQRAGLKPYDTGTLTYTEGRPGVSGEATPIATRFNVERIHTVIPMLPFFQLISWIQAEYSQHYAPSLLLSDFDQGIAVGLGLVGSNLHNCPDCGTTPYQAQLQNQGGPTYGVYGNNDHPPYASALGNRCNKIWHKAYPQHKDDIETTGTAMTYCQNINLFATAARMAGNDLTRARFDAAMSRISGFGGGVVPTLSFTGGRMSGAHRFRYVVLHDNTDNKCPVKKDGGQQGNCWLIRSGWMEERLD